MQDNKSIFGAQEEELIANNSDSNNDQEKESEAENPFQLSNRGSSIKPILIDNQSPDDDLELPQTKKVRE